MADTAHCPYCGASFTLPAGATTADAAPGWSAHVASCTGTAHELSPDGKGWMVPPAFTEDPDYWTDPNHPAKVAGRAAVASGVRPTLPAPASPPSHGTPATPTPTPPAHP